MDSINVRPATIDDTSQIAKIHVGTWQCTYRGQVPDEYLDNLSVEKKIKRWQEILSATNAKSKNFVAELDGVIVGFCTVGPCRDSDLSAETGELWSLYVDVDSMKKGVGSALLKKGFEYLKDSGYKKAILWVVSTNEKSIRWYENKGWKIEGKTKIEDRNELQLHETRYIINL